MSFNFSEETGLFNQPILITPIFTLCTGPAFYLFVKHLIYANRPWKIPDAIHFLPAIFALPFTGFPQAVILFGSISLIAYGCYSYILLRRYDNAIRTMQSEAYSMNLNWLLKLIVLFAALILVDIVRLNLQPHLSFEARNIWYFFHQLAAFFLFLGLIYLAMKQPMLFDHMSLYEQTIETQKDNSAQAINSALFLEVDQLIRQDELYLQPRLSLLDLSKSTDLNVRDLSEAINFGAGSNFNEYINGLRIDAFKSKVGDAKRSGAKVNVLKIAMECGFNSKSTFNTVFKKCTGITPTQYLNSLASA